MKMEITTRITHKYLMNKTKWELSSMILDLLREKEDYDFNLENFLVKIYKQDYKSAAIIAQMCDEYYDRSGGLLERIRAKSRQD